MKKWWRFCPACDKSLWVLEDNRLLPACPECGADTVAAQTRPPRMESAHTCDSCGEVYDEAKGDGYCGLCPSCADATEPKEEDD